MLRTGTSHIRKEMRMCFGVFVETARNRQVLDTADQNSSLDHQCPIYAL